MKYLEVARFGYRNLQRRPVRSLLTIIGIVIGVTIVVALLSLGEGLKASVLSSLSVFGSNLIFVYPGGEGSLGPASGVMMGAAFTDTDLQVIEGSRGVSRVASIAVKPLHLTYGGEEKLMLVHGIDKTGIGMFSKNQGLQTVEGRWFRDKEAGIVTGAKLPTKGFSKELKVGRELLIENRTFILRGVLKEIGAESDDTAIYIPLEMLRELTGDVRIQGFAAEITSGANPDDVAESIKNRLKRTRGLEDFMVFTNEQMINMVNALLAVIEFFIVGVAGIALVVGGIGIMNTMYTSVMERTREIGVLKAIGARESTVLGVFLFESGFLGLVGGVVGVILGFVLAKVVESIAAANGFGLLSVSMGPDLIALGLGFSFLIGVISGVFPARQASRLSPVQALRYE